MKNRPFLRGNRSRRRSHSLLHPNDVRQGVEMHLARSTHDTRSIASFSATRYQRRTYANILKSFQEFLYADNVDDEMRPSTRDGWDEYALLRIFSVDLS